MDTIQIQRIKQTITLFIRKKPLFFLSVSLIYLALTAFFRWGLHPEWGILTYVIGGFLGIYILDAFEEFIRITPSPFRSVVFVGGFVVVSLFVVTSSVGFVAKGLVGTIYITLILWMLGEWQSTGTLNSWFTMIATPTSVRQQQIFTIIFFALFLLETYIVIQP